MGLGAAAINYSQDYRMGYLTYALHFSEEDR
jgi:hypothetical protein